MCVQEWKISGLVSGKEGLSETNNEGWDQLWLVKE